MIEVGDKVSRRLMVGGVSANETEESFPGTVIYVHPALGWYTAEFAFRGGSVRESYYTGRRDGTAAAEPAESGPRPRLPWG